MFYNDMFNCINLTLGGKKTNSQLAKWKNCIEFQNAFARLVNKAMARYDFEGLPPTVNQRVLKMSLLFHGSVGWFEKANNLLALPGLPNASVTLYGDFKSMFVYGRNGYNQEISLYVPGGTESAIVNKGLTGYNIGDGRPKGIWMRENEFVYPFLNFCIAYAERISSAYRTVDIEMFHLKRPYIITAEEQVINTVKREMDKVKENEEYIVSSGVFPVDKVNVLPLVNAPENLKSTTDLIEWLYNDFDALCGKNSNSNPDKKAQISVPEVNANNQSILGDIEHIIDYMQEQLDFVNEKFGTNITVKKQEEEEDDDLSGMDSDAGPEPVAAGRSID